MSVFNQWLNLCCHRRSRMEQLLQTNNTKTSVDKIIPVSRLKVKNGDLLKRITQLLYKPNLRTKAIILFALALVGLASLKPSPTLASDPLGLVSKYSADGNADDSVSG